MTFTNQVLQEEVHAALGNRNDFTVAEGSRLERWLNIAQIKIARKKYWDELEIADSELVLAADARSLAYPANLRYQLSMVIKDGTSSRRLTWMPPQEFDRKFPQMYDTTAVISKGTPTVFTNWARSWAFWPVPDIEYTINIKKGNWPTPLSTLAQVTDLENKDDLLITLTTADIFDSLGKVEDSARKIAIYKSMLEDAIDSDEAQPGREIKPDFETGPIVGEYWNDPFIRSIG